jgi:hypothetical protein
MKKLYIKHEANILSAPQLTATITFSLGSTWFFNVSKYHCSCVSVREMFFICFF